MALSSDYIGRFAPSPSGPLHMGSLLAAVASYLDARANCGSWLVRIEDLDTPRCVAGADRSILEALDAHGLHWDGDVVYQSNRLSAYRDAISHLSEQQRVYYCQCTRKIIQASGGIYQGTCRNLKLAADNNALRFTLLDAQDQYNDSVQGMVTVEDKYCYQDPVLQRRDGIIAYNLAVVVDDIAQNISHIIRGYDLLSTTPIHLNLYQALHSQPPVYGHIPVLCEHAGHKLSKQNHARAIDNNNASSNLFFALNVLNLAPPETLVGEPVTTIIDWAVQHWQLSKVPKTAEIVVTTSDSSYHSDP